MSLLLYRKKVSVFISRACDIATKLNCLPRIWPTGFVFNFFNTTYVVSNAPAHCKIHLDQDLCFNNNTLKFEESFNPH